MDSSQQDRKQHENENQMPSGMERRLVLRLLAYWRKLCDSRRFPSPADLNPDDIPDMWPYCFVLDLAGPGQNPVFRSLGTAFVGDMALVGDGISQVRSATLIGSAVAYVPEVVTRQVPISRGGEFASDDGLQVLYRSILLPLSNDGTEITALLGAANSRELPQG